MPNIVAEVLAATAAENGALAFLIVPPRADRDWHPAGGLAALGRTAAAEAVEPNESAEEPRGTAPLQLATTNNREKESPVSSRTFCAAEGLTDCDRKKSEHRVSVPCHGGVARAR
jgi:hypothetical protein